MKYSLTGQQAFFFEKNGYIEFEQLISDADVAVLFSCIKGKQGTRDVARKMPQVQKIVCSRALAELAARLCHKKILRYAFDHAMNTAHIGDNFTVARYSAIAPLAICAMIGVDGMANDNRGAALSEMTKDKVVVETIMPFPEKPGNVVFFRPNAVWNLEAFKGHEGQSFILLVYGEEREQYLYCLEDPSLHDLKREGLVFGDQLPVKTHPVLYRSI